MRDKDYYLKIKDLYERTLLLVSDLFEDKRDKVIWRKCRFRR